jgi:hypothetical protein
MSKQQKNSGKKTVKKAAKAKKEMPPKNIVEREQFDKDGNLVCPTCKKSLRGLITHPSDSMFPPERHTTKRHKVQCCSEACTARFHEEQVKSLLDE